MRDYIKGYCTTNLDDYKRFNWPENFVSVPIVGERVQAKGTMFKELKVVRIVHCEDSNNEPIIIIELNK